MEEPGAVILLQDRGAVGHEVLLDIRRARGQCRCLASACWFNPAVIFSIAQHRQLLEVPAAFILAWSQDFPACWPYGSAMLVDSDRLGRPSLLLPRPK